MPAKKEVAFDAVRFRSKRGNYAPGAALIAAEMALTNQSIYHAPGDGVEWNWDNHAYARIQGVGRYKVYPGGRFDAADPPDINHGPDADEEIMEFEHHGFQIIEPIKDLSLRGSLGYTYKRRLTDD